MTFTPTALLREGEAILRKRERDIADLIDQTGRIMWIGGHDVPTANIPRMMASDAGHLMAKGVPFAATYTDLADGRKFSLRSAPDGLDVSEVAKLYGGGGHQHAAGFKRKFGWEGDGT